MPTNYIPSVSRRSSQTLPIQRPSSIYPGPTPFYLRLAWIEPVHRHSIGLRRRLRHVLNRLPESTAHFIYISSTGVYGDFGGRWITRLRRPNRRAKGAGVSGGRATDCASRLGEHSTILRFAGIYGPDRVPTRQLIESRQWTKLAYQGHLNLIHVDDGARIIERFPISRPR